MPVRRRINKARPDEVKAWAMYFQSGHDYFDHLEGAGLSLAHMEAPPRKLAEETWRRIGNEVIAYLDDFYRGYHPPDHPYWAEELFGPPGARRRRLR